MIFYRMAAVAAGARNWELAVGVTIFYRPGGQSVVQGYRDKRRTRGTRRPRGARRWELGVGGQETGDRSQETGDPDAWLLPQRPVPKDREVSASMP